MIGATSKNAFWAVRLPAAASLRQAEYTSTSVLKRRGLRKQTVEEVTRVSPHAGRNGGRTGT